MKNLIIGCFLLFSSSVSFGALPTYTITPITPLPATVEINDLINNIVYNIHNNDNVTRTVGFQDLTSNNITYTTTCANLASGSDCHLNLIFTAPSTPQQFNQWFGVTGGTSTVGKWLQSNIVSSPSSVSVDAAISLDTAATTASTFTVTMTDLSTSTPYIFENVPFGASTLSPSIPPDQYSVVIQPSTVTGSDSSTYDAPASYNTYINGQSHSVSFVYSKEQTYSVGTLINAPFVTSTVLIDLSNSSHSYSHHQVNGTSFYDNMYPGSYTLSAANYVGSDGQTYTASLNNPRVIDPTHLTVTITYTPVIPPSGDNNWHISHLTNLSDDNIFMVDWGGGSTTSQLQISTQPSPNPKLISDTAAYEADPIAIGVHADVKNFPDYIAMGSVSENSPTVTTQMEAQQIDTNFHYEGNTGDGNAGCAFDNSAGYHVAMSAGSGSVATIPAGTYNLVSDYYIYSDTFFVKLFHKVESFFIKLLNISGSTPNSVHYYKASLIITNTSGLNYNIAATFVETTSDITNGADVSLVKQYTFPANAIVTYTQSAPHIGSIVTPPNINLNIDGICGSVWYTSGSYTPQVDGAAAQAETVRTSNNHNLIAGLVLYTTRNSDSYSNIYDDVTNDYSVTFYLYNLLYEAYRMQYQYTTNNVDMILLLNPDSTVIFQGCTQYYCPIVWKSGITQDTVNQIVKMPNLLADANSAIDRMVAKNYMTSGNAASLKALIVSSGILTPPSGSGRTVPGMPEYYLLHNLIVRTIAPNVPFGYGQNIYDNSNPLMAVGTPPVVGAPWETASTSWIHKVNHLGYNSDTVTAAINFESAKYAQFIKDMHYASYSGDSFAAYAPDFIYYDIYERDPIPGEVGSGRAMNGVDLDTYFAYISQIDSLTNNQPMAIWQIPGSSLQVEGATFTGILAGTWPDYIFGNPALNNDMSNLAAALGIPAILFTPYLANNVYYTSNSDVANLSDYLRLTSSSP